MEQVSVITTGNDCKKLPPGFRFHPTDEEIITHYLSEKVLNSNFSPRAIAQVDLNKCEPWDLPDKAKMGEKEWYFFCQRDRKYPTGIRTNRATEAGYWKATGKDKEIYKGKGCLVGMKKTLVFYKGRAPKGEKTNWVMHEYRLEGKFSHRSLSKASKLQDEWVVCRVFHKASGIKKNSFSGNHDALDFTSLPPLLDPQYSDGNGPSSNFINRNHHDLQNQKSFPSNIYSYMTHQHNQNNPPINSTLYSQILPPNPMIPVPGSSNLGYLANSIQSFPSSSFNGTDHLLTLKDLAVTQEASSGPKDCKVEQFSNQSMASQETGLTTDVNTEISSVISKHKMGYADLQYPSAGGPVDWDCLWNY